MGCTYEFTHTPSPGSNCQPVFEVFGVPIAQRNKPQHCPDCGELGHRIISVVNFNEIFPGSTKREFLANHWTEQSVQAQNEGFRSKAELDTAIGMAQERAKQMGQPDKQLIGPVKSPYQGAKYQPTQDELAMADVLCKDKIRAIDKGNKALINDCQKAMSEYENEIKVKAEKQLTFAPTNDKDALRTQIKAAQEARKA